MVERGHAPPAWLEATDDVGDRDIAAVASALGDAGQQVHQSADRAAADAAGILVFGADAGVAADRLRELSCAGRRRVLAVRLSDCPVAAAACWPLLESGAADVLAWQAPALSAERIAVRLRRWAEVDASARSPLVRDHLVGDSRAWRAAVEQVIETALYTRAPLLVTGESGTGKELVARLVHALDPRADKGDMVVVDCTTVAPSLAGSEFFGHERGAFTGAVTARDGAFALAHRGTLFLDEVGELPLELQAELLRAIQEKTYKRVGSNRWQRTDFRLVCATNRDLAAERDAGGFRSDLYYRIAGCAVHLPPLRERLDDVVPLARRFLGELLGEDPPPELEPGVREFLVTREYPGNVRDLRQLMARIAHRHAGPGPVSVGALPPGERPHACGDDDPWLDPGFDRALKRAIELEVPAKEIANAARDRAIDLVLAEEAGNLQRASRRLGLTDRALQLRRQNGRNGGHGSCDDGG